MFAEALLEMSAFDVRVAMLKPAAQHAASTQFGLATDGSLSAGALHVPSSFPHGQNELQASAAVQNSDGASAR